MDIMLKEIEDLLEIEEKKEQEKWKREVSLRISENLKPKDSVFRVSFPAHLQIGRRGIAKDFLGSHIKTIENRTAEEKRWFLMSIRKEMVIWDPQDQMRHVLETNVREEKEKIKYVLSQKNCDWYQFISEEEKKEIVSHLYDIKVLDAQKEIGLQTEELEIDYFTHLLWLYENPFVKEIDLIGILKESKLKKYCGLEDISAIQKHLKEWYQNTSKKPVLVEPDEQELAKKWSEYRYLLDESDFTEIYQSIMDYFRKEIEKVKNGENRGYFESNTSKLKRFKEEILGLNMMKKD